MSPSKKRKNSLKRIASIFSFFGSFAFVIIGTVVLVAIGSGYSYDFRNHRTTLNGLVVIGSYPNSATIFQNGKDIHRKTPFRNTVEAQSYNYMVEKDGYQSWHKQILVKASEVIWVQYIWLLPNQLKNTLLAVLPHPTNLVPSRDHKQFAYSITSGSDAGIWLTDGTPKLPVKLYTPQPAVAPSLATGVAELPPESLAEISWADDSSHLLLHSTIGAKNSYQIISTTPGPAIALSDTFRYEFNASLRFSPTNWRELYWVSPEGLRKIDLNAQTVSAVLAEDVISYTFTGDRIVLVQNTKLGKTLSSVDHAGKDKKEIIQALADSDTYQIVFSNFKNQEIMAVLPDKARTITLYTELASGFPVAKVLSKDANHVSFSGDGRFLSYYSENVMGVYDLDKNTTYTPSFKKGITALSWFDNAHLLVTVNGRLMWAEYDGDNSRDLGKSAGTAYSSNDLREVVFPVLGSDLQTTEIHAIETKR